MEIQISIDSNTTQYQYRAMAALFITLGSEDEGVVAAPAQAPAVVKTVAPVVVESAPAAVEPEPVKRTRRTKAEIEAAAAPAPEVEVEVAVAPEPEPEPEPEVEVAVDQNTGEISGKQYSETEVQQLASIIARTKGPEIVKNKIAEFNKARIAELSVAELNQLAVFLEAQK